MSEMFLQRRLWFTDQCDRFVVDQDFLKNNSRSLVVLGEAGMGKSSLLGRLRKAIERVRLLRPVTISTDKAPTYRKAIGEENRRYGSHFDSIRHVDKKWRNNLIESDHAAMKRLPGYRQSFRSLRTAKATLSGIETIRTIKRGHIHHKQPGETGEIEFIGQLFEIAA